MISKEDNAIIEEVRLSLEQFSLRDVYRALSLPELEVVDPASILGEGKAVIGAMTLCMCLFESLSGLYSGNDTNFAQFRQKVLKEVDERYAKPKIEFLRHGLVHGQTTVYRHKEITYHFELIQGQPDRHLSFDNTTPGLEHTVINLQSFINDTRGAFNKLFEKVLEHDMRVELFKRRVEQVGWLTSPVQMESQSTLTQPATATETRWLIEVSPEQVLDPTVSPKEKSD